jgi:glutathione S-transferase
VSQLRRARDEARKENVVILHDYLPSGNGYEVRPLLTQLGIAYRRIEYDVTRGETRVPEFLGGINPNGRVPVLEMDDGEDASRVRIIVDDTDAELPRILKALDGAEVRPADLPKASFDEVYFRLVRGPQAMDPGRAVG